jgi:dTDP-4-dehydrorhamnose reductase
MKVVVLGAKGQLGRCLSDQLVGTIHDVTLAAREDIDIADLEGAKAKLLTLNPDVVINASAYTAVDKAEEEADKANEVNNVAVGNLAQICGSINSVLIHISTDYVFDGLAQTAYKESAQPNPQSVYGKTKLLGELAIQESGCNYLIIRTAWVFSEYGNNFLKTMLRLGVERDKLNVVGDQIGCPTYAQDIAKAIVTILAGIEAHNVSWGIYHYCGEEVTSWFGFAEAIFEEAKQAGLIITSPKLAEITTLEFPTLAKRPAFSVLDSSHIQADWSVQPSDWKAAIKKSLLA